MSPGGEAKTWIEPVVLEGDTVRLIPLEARHARDLWNVGQHEELWRWMPWTMECESDFERQVATWLSWADTQYGQCFVTQVKDGDHIAGSTTYLNASAPNRRVEIGATWITPAWQRTGVNTECKLLLMRHAFEVLEANRVELKTDSLNMQSRTAIARIGAREEGTLRNHMVRPDGSLRHSTYFSVTVEEWPEVQQHLLRLTRTPR